MAILVETRPIGADKSNKPRPATLPGKREKAENGDQARQNWAKIGLNYAHLLRCLEMAIVAQIRLIETDGSNKRLFRKTRKRHIGGNENPTRKSWAEIGMDYAQLRRCVEMAILGRNLTHRGGCSAKTTFPGNATKRKTKIRRARGSEIGLDYAQIWRFPKMGISSKIPTRRNL